MGHALSPHVSELVDYIWTEASGQLEHVLAVPVESIKVEQVDKAEASLLSIKRTLADKAMEKSKRGVCVYMCVYESIQIPYVCNMLKYVLEVSTEMSYIVLSKRC